MQTTDKSNKSLSSGDSTEKTQEASFMLAQRLIKQALKDLSDSNPTISFESAIYFAERHHAPICDVIDVDSEFLRERVVECLKESGVRRKRLVNDLIEDFNNRANTLN